MTYQEANRLITMLTYNFAAFMPIQPLDAAAKKGLWAEELVKYDAAAGEKAVKKIIQTSPYPPTIYDFRAAMGFNPDLTRDEAQARLPGPTWDTPEGMKAQYAFDHDRVDRMMADLDKELAAMPGLERTRR